MQIIKEITLKWNIYGNTFFLHLLNNLYDGGLFCAFEQRLQCQDHIYYNFFILVICKIVNLIYK